MSSITLINETEGRFMQLGKMIKVAATRFGDAPAVRTADEVVSFAEFDRRTDRLANNLLASGVVPGDRVGILLPNGVEILVAYFALAKAGLVRVVLNWRDTPEDHAFKLRDAGCRAFLAAGVDPGVDDIAFQLDVSEVRAFSLSGTAAPCLVPRSDTAPHRLAYTGGTTGRPKAVILGERQERTQLTNYLKELIPDIGQGDVMLHAAALTHATSSFFLPHFVSGACNVILDTFEPAQFLDVLEHEQATCTFLVPTMISMLLREAESRPQTPVTTLRYLAYGAAPISPSTAARAESLFGAVLTQDYGQAEAPMGITYLRAADHDRIGSAGRAFASADVRLHDEDGKEAPVGQEGEVVVRGDIVMDGYWRRPEETATTLRNRWLHTGDIGRFDEDGFLYLLDRKNDVIISGGFNVYPREVEDALMGHASVHEVAVVGIPDDLWGERVCAVVLADQTITADELIEFVRPKLANYKRPKEITFVADLPKSPAGKILRRSVRDVLATSRQDPARAHPSSNSDAS